MKSTVSPLGLTTSRDAVSALRPASPALQGTRLRSLTAPSGREAVRPALSVAGRRLTSRCTHSSRFHPPGRPGAMLDAVRRSSALRLPTAQGNPSTAAGHPNPSTAPVPRDPSVVAGSVNPSELAPTGLNPSAVLFGVNPSAAEKSPLDGRHTEPAARPTRGLGWSMSGRLSRALRLAY
jgi:hypothetical protein